MSDDTAAIATVRRLVHRVGMSPKHCQCTECRAIVRVCALAHEAIAMKAAAKRRAKRAAQHAKESERLEQR